MSPIDEFVSSDTVREKLIIAGISELERHGIADFSLRRVASSCNVSCAAPYKHFRSKEDFIGEIIDYIHDQWMMLQGQIMSVFENDTAAQIVQMCVGYIRFWIGNSHFRAVLMMHTDSIAAGRANTKQHMSRSIRDLTAKYCRENCIPESEQEQMAFRINALVYGAALMTDNNMLSANEETISMLKNSIEKELRQ